VAWPADRRCHGGSASGFSVLDVDAGQWSEEAKPEVIARHESARAWWHCYAHLIPPTRTYRSRSGGLHLAFRHAPDVTSTTNRIAPGVDTRGNGGYIVFWFAAGLACLDHSPPAPWPEWLTAMLQPRLSRLPFRRMLPEDGVKRSVDGLLRLIATAAPGERNTVLHWGACRLGERVRTGQIAGVEAEARLVAAGMAVGLPEHEARATARSGLRRPRA
jgi:hypothetical protein